MDLNQHSFIRTAFDDQTILISKAKFETAVHFEDLLEHRPLKEIGRASCRERV